jgi:hypothetical protein
LHDEFLIEVHAIGQEHILKGALVLVLAVCLDRDFFPEGKGRATVLTVAQRLAFLGAINHAEADMFSFVVLQDFDGFASRTETTGQLEGLEGETRDAGSSPPLAERLLGIVRPSRSAYRAATI